MINLKKIQGKDKKKIKEEKIEKNIKFLNSSSPP